MTTIGDLPDGPLRIILSNLCIRDLLALRKVSPDFRNFIETMNPDFKLRTIDFGLDASCAYLVFWDVHGKLWQILYEHCKEGCEVVYYRRKLIVGENFMDVFFKDLAVILKNRKSSIHEILVGFKNHCRGIFNNPVKAVENTYIFMEKLKEVLMSQPEKLQVTRVTIGAHDQKHIMALLPYLKPGVLTDLIVATDPWYCETLEINEIAQLEHWNFLKCFVVDRETFVSGKIENCFHIPEIVFRTDKIDYLDIHDKH